MVYHDGEELSRLADDGFDVELEEFATGVSAEIAAMTGS